MATEHTMKSFDPDDPLLTAYALGELEGEELREIEALVARDPAAARHVESIRAAASGFGEAFEREPAPAVAPIRAVEIEPKRRAPIIPWLFYASTAAVACFFVVLVIHLADPAALEKESNLAAEAVLQGPPAPDSTDSAAVGSDVRAAAVEQAAGDELRRQSADLRKEKSEIAGAAASAAEPEAAMADKEESSFGSLRKRDDSLAAKSAAAAPPAVKLGETKDAARGARARENEGEMRSFDSVARSIDGRKSYSLIANLRATLAAGSLPESLDAAALLAELGLRELQEYREGDQANLAQTTRDQSPMPDPEAALMRAVEGFARLVAARTPASEDSWDRVLADARYAAGSDPNRLEFVALVEQARGAMAVRE
jgi:hypothetical protein